MHRLKNLFSALSSFSVWTYYIVICGPTLFFIYSHWNIFKDHSISDEKAITFVGAFIAFSLAFTQYVISQKWKKTEFLAQEYKAFVSDKYVQRAMYLLDFPFSNFQLFDSEVISDKNSSNYFISYPNTKIVVCCDFEIVAKALSEQYDDEKKEEFNSAMNIIRYTFDKFSFRLGLFQKHISSGLIKIEDLKPYLQYWIDTIINPGTYRLDNNQHSYKKMKIELIRYLHKYDYISLHLLLQKFGTNINELFLTHLDSAKLYRIKSASENYLKADQGSLTLGDGKWKII